MRDIVLYLMAVALVAAASLLVILESPGTDQMDEATRDQVAAYRSQAAELKTWTDRL